MSLPTSIPAMFNTTEIQDKINATNCTADPENWVVTVIPVCILLMSVIGIVLNVFVLMVFCLHKEPCTLPEIYLMNLSIADLVLLTCLPFWAVNLSKNFDWPFGLSMCKIVNVGINMNTFCSIYFIVLVCYDRYLALVFALSHNRMRRPKYAKLSCMLMWGVCVLISVPQLIYRTTEPSCGKISCYVFFQDHLYYIYEIIITLLIFIIPLSIITFCTVNIVKSLNNRVVRMTGSHNSEHKATTLVLAVLVVFLICWLPFHILRALDVFIEAGLIKVNNATKEDCMQIFVYMAFFNSVLNPILYVIVGKNFQRKAKGLFKPQRRGSSFRMITTFSSLSRSV
ncbi:uncharacterized protein V6R79_000754 [Siganus canaliculatus]